MKEREGKKEGKERVSEREGERERENRTILDSDTFTARTRTRIDILLNTRSVYLPNANRKEFYRLDRNYVCRFDTNRYVFLADITSGIMTNIKSVTLRKRGLSCG